MFGSDNVKARESVADIRRKVVMELKKSFEEFVALEKKHFMSLLFFVIKSWEVRKFQCRMGWRWRRRRIGGI